MPASASTPALPESGPRTGRKNVAGENSGWRPRDGPTGARMASQTNAASRARRSNGRAVTLRPSANTMTTSQVTSQVPRSAARSLAAPCSGGTGRTLKSSRGPAVVGSS